MKGLYPTLLLRMILLSAVIGMGTTIATGQYRKTYRQQLPGIGTVNEQISRLFKSNNHIGWLAVSKEIGLNGTVYNRFQQTYLGLPVENAIITVQTNKDGSYVTGHYSDMTGTAKSIRLIDASKLISRSAIATELSQDEYSSEPVWLLKDGSFQQVLKVSYFSHSEFSEKTVFILPETSEMVEKHQHKCHLNYTGTAQTQYHGSCLINTQLYQNFYRLRSVSGTTEISTLDLNHQLHYHSVTEITDADNFWEQNNHAYATDAHFCAEQYLNFIQGTFQRNSIDNNGYPLNSYINYGQNLANAFWNGSAVVYGSGNTASGALTVIDIAGHEFTHGLIQKTAGLAYSNEPGTINEAISDIFGEVLDRSVFPSNQTWTIAERTGQPLRSFSAPLLYGQPSEFHGTNWYYGTGDNGGVHINSGFINHWFYLLSEGGTGVNSKNWSYSLSGIGFNKAVKIVYESLIGYLVPQSGFEEFYHATLSATIDLYGYCSPEYLAVCEAWKAVGFINHTTVLPVINSTTQEICDGETVLLSAEGLTGSQFHWIYNGQPMTESGMTLSAGDQGFYQVSENRCGNILVSIPLFLTVNPLPLVTASDVAGCPGEAINLSGFPSGGIFSLPLPYSGPDTHYSYTYTDGNGCSAIATAVITRHQVHLPSISASLYSVPVNDNPLVLLSDSGTTFSGPGVDGNLFYPERAGVGGPYPVQVHYTDANGCHLSNSVDMTVLPPCRNLTEVPEIKVEEIGIPEGNRITLKAENTNEFELIWKISGDFSTITEHHKTEVSFTTLAKFLEVELWFVNTCSDSAYVRKIITPKQCSGWLFYPNPVQDQLIIEGCGVDFYSITDINGKVVENGSGNLIQNQIRIETDNLESGMYFILVTEKGNETRRKFLKK